MVKNVGIVIASISKITKPVPGAAFPSSPETHSRRSGTDNARSTETIQIPTHARESSVSEISTQADLTEDGYLALLEILTIFEDGQKIQDGQGCFS